VRPPPVVNVRTVAAAFVMLLMASCSPHHTPTPTVPTPSSPTPEATLAVPSTIAGRCAHAANVRSGDFDGDGKRDVAYEVEGLPATDAVVAAEERSLAGIRMGVCTAAGARDEIDPGGMGQIFGPMDVEPDGRVELVAGLTTAVGEQDRIYVLRGGRLHEVTLNGQDFLLFSGIDLEGDESSWGCADVSGDARRELIQITQQWPRGQSADGRHGRWTRQVFGFDGEKVTLLKTDSGDAGTDPNRPTVPKPGLAECAPT